LNEEIKGMLTAHLFCSLEFAIVDCSKLLSSPGVEDKVFDSSKSGKLPNDKSDI
jgi:hypothetical protein